MIAIGGFILVNGLMTTVWNFYSKMLIVLIFIYFLGHFYQSKKKEKIYDKNDQNLFHSSTPTFFWIKCNNGGFFSANILYTVSIEFSNIANLVLLKLYLKMIDWCVF